MGLRRDVVAEAHDAADTFVTADVRKLDLGDRFARRSRGGAILCVEVWGELASDIE